MLVVYIAFVTEETCELEKLSIDSKLFSTVPRIGYSRLLDVFFSAPPREERFLEPVYDPRNLENFGFPLRSLTLLSVEAYTLQQLEVESVSLQNYEFLGFRFL